MAKVFFTSLLWLAAAATVFMGCDNSSGGGGAPPTPPANVPTDDMVFISTRDGNEEVYSSIGGVVTRVTNTTVHEKAPAWSPDGTKILFVSDTNDPTELWIMDTDGSNPQPLPIPADSDGVQNPHWASNGAAIVYSRFSTNLNSQVITIQQYPSGISDDLVRAFDPQFAPGGKILFATNNHTQAADGNADIWIMDDDGMNPVQLTDSMGHDDLTPVYFAAENRIAWVEWVGVGNVYTGSVLKTMELDGTDKVEIFNMAGHEPDWPTGAGGTLYFTDFDGLTERIRKLKPDGTSVYLDFGGDPDTTPSVKGG